MTFLGANMSKTFWLIIGASIAIVGFLVFRNLEEPAKFSPNRMTSETSPIEKNGNLQSWHSFRSPSNKFNAMFPTLPQHATSKINEPKTQEPRQYDMYVSEKDDGTIFMISIITMLDESNKINENALTNVINDILSNNPKGKIKSMKLGSYREYPAIDFSIENDKINIDGKAFIVGNTLYLLTSAANLENYQKPEFDFFVNSFELSEVAQQKDEKAE